MSRRSFSTAAPGRLASPVLKSVDRHRDGAKLAFEVDGQRASVIVGRAGLISFPHPFGEAGESLGTPEADEAVREAARLEFERAKLSNLLGGRS
jgi:hypothetical protein